MYYPTFNTDIDNKCESQIILKHFESTERRSGASKRSFPKSYFKFWHENLAKSHQKKCFTFFKFIFFYIFIIIIIIVIIIIIIIIIIIVIIIIIKYFFLSWIQP